MAFFLTIFTLFK